MLHPTTTPAGIDFAVELHAASTIAPLNPAVARPQLPEKLPDGARAVLFTSGTTGEPRAVCLTRQNFEASARATAASFPFESQDRWLCCLPVHHVAGFSIFTRCAIYGATVYVERWDAERVKAVLEAGEVTVASFVPTMLIRLREAGLEHAPGLKGILLGGGPAPDELLAWASAVGLPVMPTYGLTETCSQVATAEVGQRLARPLPGAEIEISDEGEILVRGPMVATEGWLHTGDRGSMTEEGLLTVEGRMDDLIVTGGENVAAAEVEAALLEHPAVTDAAVIGVDDPEWGRAVTAFVVATAPEDEIAAHARSNLPGFKAPKRIFVLDELPRTASGKVQRAQLESRAHDLRQGR